MAHPELEFFILSIVYEHHHHLSIFEAPELGVAVNRHPPDFTRDELIETLSDMFCCGDVTARRKNSKPFIPTPEEIDAGLCDALDITFGLTLQGGARWEKMARFDWNYHLGGWFEDGFEGPSREMMEAYLTWTRSAVPGSEMWKVVRPWKATYWKSFPKGVRVQYRNAPEKSADQYKETRDLWVDEWNGRRHAEMQVFIPMKTGRTEPQEKTRWRIQFRSVGQRKTSDLLHLLNNADSAVQYAAGTSLVRIGDPSITATLLEWFLRRRSRFALRVISQIHDPRALEALVQVFETETWDDKIWDNPFRRDLRLAIGAFGRAAVPKLAPLLRSELVKMQIAVLEALGDSRSEDAGTLILSWLETLKDDVSNEYLQDVALTILAKLGYIRAVPLLAKLIHIKSYRAVKPLMFLDHPDAWKVLEDFVQSGANTHAHRLAARHLCRVNPSYREQYERLDQEAHSNRLHSETILFVGRSSTMDIGNPIKALITALEDSDPRRRVGAISLLCRHEGEFPKERVAVLINDPEPEVRANAVYALGLRGSESEVPKIQRLTSDSSGLVRYCAGEALKRLSLSSI